MSLHVKKEKHEFISFDCEILNLLCNIVSELKLLSKTRKEHLENPYPHTHTRIHIAIEMGDGDWFSQADFS